MELMSNWKVTLVAGLVAGMLLASAIGHLQHQPTVAEMDNLREINTEQAEQIQSLSSRLETMASMETQKAIEFKELQQQLEQKTLELSSVREEHAKQMAALKQQKKQLVVTKKQLDTKVETLTEATQKQQTVLSNSKALYQQQLGLQKQLSQVEADVKQARRVAEEFKKPCDEFKSGKSWNWVSQADCDRYEAKLSKVAEAEVERTALQNELDELNEKINVTLPKDE